MEARDGVCDGRPIELRTFATEAEMLLAFERFVTSEVDPDVLLTYDARCLGLVAERYGSEVLGYSKAKAKAKGKNKATSAGVTTPFNLSRSVDAETRVASVVTYGKQWVAKGGRQQTAENLETSELTGVTGRFSCDLLRALVVGQSHKLTTYSFAQAVEAVLSKSTELVLPEVLARMCIQRLAHHTVQQARQVSELCRKLKTVEETVEMARLTGLPLRTITNQAQMVRTENLLLKAARTLGYVLPLNTISAQLRWPSSLMASDGRAYQHWPWPRAELDGEQRWCIDIGIAGHCTKTAARTDGSAGLHSEPVAVLDFASLYPSCFIAHNICFSTLLPPNAHNTGALAFDATPDTVEPNSRCPGVASPFDMYPSQFESSGSNEVRRWPGSAIAFASRGVHRGLMPRLLERLLSERRAIKARVKQLRAIQHDAPDSDASEMSAVLDARQLTLKLLANASYGFCGADTSHLCCKPLAEACLRFGNFYCRLASSLIEADGAGHCASAESPSPRWPGAHVIYANTDSVFIKLPGYAVADAVQIGQQMAEYVSTHPQLPPELSLEFERVLFPCLLDGHNRYAGAEWVTGHEASPPLHQKGLLERTQCAYVQSTIMGTMRALLVDRSLEDALEYGLQAARVLLAGKVSASELVEGGFLKRANQKDLLRMAGLGAKEAVDSVTREADRTLSKSNAYALAIHLLQTTAVDGQPTRVFRLGEYVPFLLVSRYGGASSSTKQFENVATLDEVVLHRVPVNLKLLYTNRLIPALFGQVQERLGTTSKAAAQADKPALLGRLVTSERVAAFRSAASRVSSNGVLTCAESWKLFGLSGPPKDRTETSGKGGQTALSAFFTKKPPDSSKPLGSDVSPVSAGARAGNPSVTPERHRGDKETDEQTLHAELLRLHEQRAAIARASGRVDGSEPLLLYNLAAPLANTERQLAALRR